MKKKENNTKNTSRHMDMEKTMEFIKKTNAFFKKHNIKPKKFGYKSGLSFLEFFDDRKNRFVPFE